MDVPVELARIVIVRYSDQQTIYLREKQGERAFPIAIGVAEAYAIDRRLKKIPVLRPMTHDLLANVIGAMGGRLERIVINDLRKLHPEHRTQTFIATLHIRRDGELIEVDSRPSDAVALGIGMDTPIFVAEHVLDTVTSMEPPSPQEQAELLRERLEILREQITERGARLSDEQFLAEEPAEVIRELRRRVKKMKAEYEFIRRVLEKLE